MNVYLIFHENYTSIRQPHLLLPVFLFGEGADFHISRYLSFNLREMLGKIIQPCELLSPKISTTQARLDSEGHLAILGMLLCGTLFYSHSCSFTLFSLA